MNTGALFAREEVLRIGKTCVNALNRQVIWVEIEGTFDIGEVVDGGTAYLQLYGDPTNTELARTLEEFSGVFQNNTPSALDAFRSGLRLWGHASYKNRAGSPQPSPTGKVTVSRVSIGYNGVDAEFTGGSGS